jgi:hypothetical protein
MFGVPTLDTIGTHQEPDYNYRGRYGIWYGAGHTAIQKPFLIVSGFDPSDGMRIQIEDEPEPHKKVYLYDVANVNGFLDNLREQGYDIIAYRCVNSLESIINNGDNLIDFMRNVVIANMPEDNQLYMVGASMGGLLVRYALTKMEYDGIDHKCGLFISLDSPQEGANIPLGFQHLIVAMNKNLKIFDLDILKDGQASLDCPAAQEMLIYHHTRTLTNSANHSRQRDTYLREMDRLGSFPRRPLSFAISQGSGNGVGQGFEAGETTLKLNRTSIQEYINPLVFTDLLVRNTLGLVTNFLLYPPLILNVLGLTTDDYAHGRLPFTLKAEIRSISNGYNVTIASDRLGFDYNLIFCIFV